MGMNINEVKTQFIDAVNNMLQLSQNSSSLSEDQFRLKICSCLESLRVDAKVEVSINAQVQGSAKSKIDIVVYDRANPDNYRAVFEVKKPGSTEMIYSNSPTPRINVKALHQIIYYYLLRQYSDVPYMEDLHYYVVTDTTNWYFFDNTSFAYAFQGKGMKTLISNLGLDTKNPPLVSSYGTKRDAYGIIEEYCNRHPNVLKQLFAKSKHIVLSINDDQSKSELFDLLFFMFYPDVKPPTKLNKNFYDELLYIMGLKETSKHSSGENVATIVFNGVKNSFAGQLDGSLQEDDRLKEEDMQLLTLWFNRILFLKLLEANLIKFNGDNLSYKFMSVNKSRINDFRTLEDLFFEAVAKPVDNRSINNFNDVPYLNSSLFERHQIEIKAERSIGYVANRTIPYYSKSILLKKNNQQQQDDLLLNYLFSFLDEYDFGSGKESDSEKLISPAVLGLVFEKLNGYKDGSYYTPDNITSFMADYAVRSALVAKVNEALGTHFYDYNDVLEEYRGNSPRDIGAEGREKIRQVIKNLKILDPAVGSGHFLVSALDTLLQIWFDFKIDGFGQNAFLRKRMGSNGTVIDEEEKPVPYIRKKESNGSYTVNATEQAIQQTLFNAKKHIIEHNLYGVDINPNAVEIAKLRLWIELLESAYYKEPDFKQMETLPNLEFKIICADSLIPLQNDTAQLNFLDPYVANMKQLMQEYFEESDKTRKEDIKTIEFPALLSQIKQASAFLGNDVQNKLDSWNPFGNAAALFFDPELMFGTDQFDVIITNPPYIQLQRNGGELAKKYAPYSYETFDRKGDIYTLFIERGLNMLQDNGYLCYITSNKWLRSGYGGKVRSYLLNKNSHAQLDILIDLGPGVFENAAVDTCILGVKKVTSPSSLGLKTLDLTKEDITTANISECLNDPDKVTVMTKLDSGPWFFGKDIDQRIKEKVETFGVPLKGWKVDIYYGIKTGCNDAFIIDSDTRKKILDGCRSDEELKLTNSVIKKRLRGKNVNRYSCSWDGNWIIVIPSGWTNQMKGSSTAEDFMNANLPSLMGHLNTYKDRLLARDDKGDYWWELRPCSYYDEFDKEKVIWREIVNRPSFYYDNEHFYVEATGFIMTGDNLKYLCGVLNSKPCAFVFKRYYSGGGLGEEGYRYKKAFMMALPVPLVSDDNSATVRHIEEIVEKVTEMKKQNPDSDTSTLEAEIDELVYELYGLSTEEREYIEKQMKVR